APRFPAEVLYRVRDLGVAGTKARFLHRAPQQSARGSDERLSLPVLVVAGLLADQHQACPSWALAGHALRRALPQRTAATGVEIILARSRWRGHRPSECTATRFPACKRKVNASLAPNGVTRCHVVDAAPEDPTRSRAGTLGYRFAPERGPP